MDLDQVDDEFGALDEPRRPASGVLDQQRIQSLKDQLPKARVEYEKAKAAGK